MSETPLANDEAARSTTGEILDVRPEPTKVADTSTTTIPSTTETTTSNKPTAQPNATITKPAEGETLLTDKKDDEAKDTPKAPEAYTAFVAPEGVTLDPKAIEAATPIFKELGLTQDQAQKLVNLQAQREADAAKAPKATYDTLRQTWRSEVQADKDIAGYSVDGKSGIDAVKVDIGRALNTLDPKLASDFRQAMDLTGAGDNPAFVKAFWKLSQSVVEGRPVSGRGPSPLGQKAPGAKPPSAAQALYPGLPSAG